MMDDDSEAAAPQLPAVDRRGARAGHMLLIVPRNSARHFATKTKSSSCCDARIFAELTHTLASWTGQILKTNLIHKYYLGIF